MLIRFFLLNFVLLSWSEVVSVTRVIANELPVDQALSQLYQGNQLPPVNQIKNALSALREKNTEKVKTLAQFLQKNSLFSDFGFALAGETDRLKAELKFSEKKYVNTIKLGQSALRAFSQIEIVNPYSPLLIKIPEILAETEFLLANAQLAKKDTASATALYENAFQRLQASPIPGALAKTPISILSNYSEQCAKVKNSLCKTWIQKLLSLFPRQSAESKAIQKSLPSEFEWPKSPPLFKKLTQTYRAPDLDSSAIEESMRYYWEGKTTQAIEALQKFLENYPRSSHRYRARYWLAQALKMSGETEHAKVILTNLTMDAPLTYFGLFASQETLQKVEFFLDATLPTVSLRDRALLPSEQYHVQRAEYFLGGGLKELAAAELLSIRPREALSNGFLLYVAVLLNEAESYRHSFVFLSELIQRGDKRVMTSYGLRLIFPAPHWNLIEPNATQMELDPILILSLIKQESAFDRFAVSISGASGLMQLMPATALEVDSLIQRMELYSAATNIQLGARYLKQMLNRYQGNIAIAFAAYNAGPVAVDRWIQEGKTKRGIIGFIDSIPYPETREYVASLIRNYYWYHQKLRGTRLESFSEFWVDLK